MSVEIYEITEYQQEILEHMAGDDEEPWVVLEINEGDLPEVVERFQERKSAAADLLTLGLIEDKSSVMVEAVVGFKLKANRTVSIYYISDIGKKMFAETNTLAKAN